MKRESTNIKTLRRLLVMLLLTGAVFLSAMGVVHADGCSYSETLWTNGCYDSTLGDMAGRRLYVYGLIDSQGQNEIPDRDDRIDLAPEKPVSRLEAAEALYRLCGEAEPDANCHFTDVPEDYAEAVTWLYAAGATRGISREQFGTGEITAVQFFTLLSRLFSWESSIPDAHWGNLVYEERLIRQAREKNLLPAGTGRAGFTHGDMYLTLLALAEQELPDALRPQRPQMSRPNQITLTAGSFLDAETQIAAAVRYAPARIRVNFLACCPEYDLEAFREKYDTGNPAYQGEYPFTAIVNTDNSASCKFYRRSRLSYDLAFDGYAPAYLACLDTLDWLRCYADETYCQRISEFKRQEIIPLLSDSPDEYGKICRAQGLVCRIASYDWNEYDAIVNHGTSPRPETHSISGFLDDGVIVCDGYAKAFQWILRCLGIESFVVYGTGDGDNHAWNKVRLDGVWYNLDVCWRDTLAEDTFFLKSDSWFQLNRRSFKEDYATTAFSSESNYSAQR